MGFHSLKYALMALLMLLSLATGAVAAVQVRVMPPAPSGVVGSTITVTIEADSVSDLGGFQFGFGYSTADLEALSATINPAFDQVIAQELGATTGSGMIAAAVFDNVTVTGNSVPLATINFKILKPVTTSINLTTVILGQIGGTEIPSSAVGGTVVGTTTGSKTNQTLSFGSAPTVVVGGTGTVSAIATSGLAVSYASTTPDICTVTGGTVTGIATGTCTITADQAGDVSYNQASQVTQSFVVTAAEAVCVPKVSGLVSWWKGEGNALDQIGGNNGTLTNGATFAAGKSGQAFSLNGSGQYVLVADPVPLPLNIQTEITIGAWIYTGQYPVDTGYTTSLGLIAGSQFDTNIAGASIFLDGRTNTDGQATPQGHIHFQIGDGSAWHATNSLTAVPLNQWVHVVATRKANEEGQIYYNGVLQPSTAAPWGPWSGTISYNGAWFAIGQQKDINRPFNGLIDEVQMYNRALTPSEVTAIYRAGSASVCVDTVTPVQTFILTFATAGNGTLSGSASQTIAYGGAATPVTALPAFGYHFVNWTAGAAVAGTSASLTISPVTAAGSYTANFAADPVNGVCGARNGGVFIAAPTADLCATGVATGVTGNGPWSWSCGGINGGTPASCSAAIDITGPVLTVSTLGNGAITNSATLNISGTVSDSSAVAGLTINNTAVSVTNGTFSAVITLQEGGNTVTVIAADALGNSTSNSRTLTLDSSAPILTVTAPADNSTTAQAVAMISGTINETSTVTVSVNNGTPQSASLTGNNFNAAINLAVGLNSITITATDLAGNTASTVRTVTYDNTKLSLAITNPNQDITIAQNTITISGTVSGAVSPAIVTVTFNSQNYTPEITSGTFSQLLTIPAEGTWPVTATATDAGNNSSSVVRNIIYAIPVNGVCGSSNGATFAVLPTTNLCATGAAAQVSGTGPWSWSCGGTNGGSAASCSAGLSAAAVDTIAPVVTSFIISATSATRTVPVTCLIATDAVGVTGYLLSESATVPLLSDPAWSASAQSAFTCSTWGNKTIYAYARDAAGHISDAKSSNVYIGNVPEADGVIVDAQGKTEPLLADALMSLKFAMKLEIPSATQITHGKVAPLVNGVPQPDPGRTELNLGDTIVILRRVVGL